MKLAAPLALLAALSSLTAAQAQLRLPHALSDHAVLQREAPIHLWGWATPGADVKATLHAQNASAKADRTGQWSLYLAPEQAGGPYSLTLTSEAQTTTFKDILIGDVWFASGQSNMEFPLAGFIPGAPMLISEKEIAAATQPNIRLLRIEHKASDYPVDDTPATWTECTPATAKNFSAIAYFFGREISQREHVPIGLIDSTWGGTPADSWVSLLTLGTDPQLLPAFASRARYAEEIARFPALDAADQREAAEDRAAGRTPIGHPWRGDPLSWNPAALFNGMIAPFTPMQIKGFLWYQGETNSGAGRAPAYETLFQSLIRDWRARFAQGNLPFLYVQISSFNSPGEDWGLVRDAQRRALSLTNTAMAVTLDVGQAENVHPPDKLTPATRLALAARATVYNDPAPYNGPTFRQATVMNNTVQVWFDHAKGLNFRGPGQPSFELAGPDHHFLPAQARIEGETVLVTAADLPHPVYVRYGWPGVITQNLFNADNLPASTFTSEPTPRQ